MPSFRPLRFRRERRPEAPQAQVTGSPATTWWGTTFSSLVVPSFRVLMIANAFSMAAMQMGVVARAWLAYDISGSATTLGVVAMATGVPQMLCSLIAGVAAERLDKRTLLILTQLCLGTLALINAVLVYFQVVEVWHLVLLGALQGFVFSFNVPARLGFIPELVGKEHLSNGVALNSLVVTLNGVIGPAIVGILIAWNPAVAFFSVAAAYWVAAIVQFKLPHSWRSAGGKAVFPDMLFGFRYIWDRPVLRTLMGLSFIPLLLGLPFQQLLPVFQAAVFAVGPRELGFMNMSFGLGSLFGALLIARLATYPRKGLLQMVGGVGFGLGLLFFAASPSYEISLPLLLIAGVACQCFLTINSVLVSHEADRKMYGRVISINMISWSLLPSFALPWGALIDVIGARPSAGVAGALLAGSVLAFALLLPGHWRSDRKAAEVEIV